MTVHQVLVRECALCRQPVIYWDGDFRHLTDVCPSGPKTAAGLATRARSDIPPLEKVTTPPRLRGALRYRCPRCHAEPGKDCRTGKGLQTLTPHVARQDLHAVATGRRVLDNK